MTRRLSSRAPTRHLLLTLTSCRTPIRHLHLDGADSDLHRNDEKVVKPGTDPASASHPRVMPDSDPASASHSHVMPGTDPASDSQRIRFQIPAWKRHGASKSRRNTFGVRNDIGLLGWVFGRISRQSESLREARERAARIYDHARSSPLPRRGRTGEGCIAIPTRFQKTYIETN